MSAIDISKIIFKIPGAFSLYKFLIYAKKMVK